MWEEVQNIEENSKRVLKESIWGRQTWQGPPSSLVYPGQRGARQGTALQDGGKLWLVGRYTGSVQTLPAGTGPRAHTVHIEKIPVNHPAGHRWAKTCWSALRAQGLEYMMSTHGLKATGIKPLGRRANVDEQVHGGSWGTAVVGTWCPCLESFGKYCPGHRWTRLRGQVHRGRELSTVQGLEYAVSLTGGPQLSGHRAWTRSARLLGKCWLLACGWSRARLISSMSPSICTAETSWCRNKEKQTRAHWGRGRRILSFNVPPAPSTDKACHCAHCKVEEIAESSPLSLNRYWRVNVEQRGKK